MNNHTLEQPKTRTYAPVPNGRTSWTKRDKQMLVKAFKERVGNEKTSAKDKRVKQLAEEMAPQLGRTESAVKQYLRKAKLTTSAWEMPKKENPTKSINRTLRKFTTEEDQHLIKYGTTQSVTKLSSAMGRHPKSIRQRINILIRDGEMVGPIPDNSRQAEMRRMESEEVSDFSEAAASVSMQAKNVMKGDDFNSRLDREIAIAEKRLSHLMALKELQ